MNPDIIKLISKSLNSIKGKCRLKDQAIADQLNISCSELNCMKKFMANSHLSVKDLAEKLNITSGGVTKIVGNLEEKGILRRDMDPEDRRGIIVSLTPEGEVLTKNLKNTTLKYYNELFKGLSEDEKQKILKGLQLLNEAWGNSKSESDDENC